MSRLTALLLLALPLGARAEPLLKKHSARPLQAESELDSLEPWETPIEGFFIRSHHDVPVVDAERWTLRIDGLVERPLTLTLADLRALEERSLYAVLECAGNGRGLQRPRAAGLQWERGAVGNARWTGTPLAALLRRAGVKPEARFVTVEGADKPALPSVPGFIRSIPLEKALREDTLLAWGMNREPMPVLHGGPLRLVLPGWYGQNWIKWVTRVTLSAAEDPGFYMSKGYRMPRTPVAPGEKWDSAAGAPIEEMRVQSLIVRPRPGQALAQGRLRVAGKAFSGAGVIERVDVSIDGTKTWTAAELEPPHDSGGWQEFYADVELARAGPVTLLSRARDAAGNVQPLEADWNPAGYLRNAVDRVEVSAGAAAAADAGEVLRRRCLVCHTEGMITGQRLDPGAWDKVLSKMEGFGAKLAPEERGALRAHLARLSPELPLPPLAATDFALEAALLTREGRGPGKAARGAALYAERCAACHGKGGEGETGPRLKGRAVPEGLFHFASLHGRGAMPAFGTELEERQIADLRSFLQE